MKRIIVFVAALSLLLAACAVTAPGTAGVITEVKPGAVTVSANGQTTTYTTSNRTNVYSVDGNLTSKAALSTGQNVTVWANGTSLVRINIEP